MISIIYGTLPTPSFFRMRCRTHGIRTDRELLEHLRDMLKRHGPCPYVEASLKALGITWAPPPGASELDLDVAAVIEALNSPAPSTSNQAHGAPKLEGVRLRPSTTGAGAGEVVEHDGSHENCRFCAANARWERAF